LAQFQSDHPNASEAAFIMMNFGYSETRAELVRTIKSVLWDAGIAVLRADDKQYHDDLFYNILTYIHGCGIGIAVFERTDAQEFNPNVSLEVGYMMALGKPVCFLKDEAWRALNTDLFGKLYIEYSPQYPSISMQRNFRCWLEDKGLKGSSLPHLNPRLGKRP